MAAKKKSTKRMSNEPRNVALREAMKKFGTRSKVDSVVDRTFREFNRKHHALEKWGTFIAKNLERYRDQIQEKMGADGVVVRSLVLIHQSGREKVYVAVRVRMIVDSRGELAIKKIREFLDQYAKAVEIKDENVALMIELLKDLFVQRRKELIVTQGLLNFTKLDRKKIKDQRLRDAHKILKEAIHSEESGPVIKLYVRPDKKWVPYQPEAVGRGA